MWMLVNQYSRLAWENDKFACLYKILKENHSWDIQLKRLFSQAINNAYQYLSL